MDGKLNPADFCTRGIQAHEAEKWRTFHQGPDFLWKPKSEWPTQKEWCFNMPKIIRAAYVSMAATQVNLQPQLPPPPPPQAPLHPFDAVYEAADRVGEWLVKLRQVAFMKAAAKRWLMLARKRIWEKQNQRALTRALVADAPPHPPIVDRKCGRRKMTFLPPSRDATSRRK